MAAKMDLLILPSTGHILAAAVRADTSGPPPDAAALVGDGLLFREAASGDAQLTLPAQHLGVQSIDLREDVLLTARQFVLVDGLPELGTEPDATPLELDGATIKVNVADAAPAGGSTVWVYIEGAPQPVVQRVEVLEGDTAGEEDLLLPPGTYRALVLAPGHQAVVVEETVT